ncbi:PepSY domain-containing protein [Methanolobus sediminis]|uniref:PepSY domain-containing protein n=1 Tax=Methanolobus sediminis TaxID=3072978 RepID=A0AA51YL79_9EURY|nr:PepSY domain-containing protein [Methanolobus sediminis]WMW24704.1 PepSY domain-containing protein [Methanolobus sediminis]
MRKITTILLAGMLIAAIAGIGMASAATDETDDATFFGHMYRWAGQCVGYANGYMNGYGYADCPVYGAYATDGATVDIAVDNVNDAIAIAEDATGQTISESDVYQMGRWWVFTYSEDDTVKQGRIDAYTGDVIEDFYTDSTYQGQYYQGGRGMRGSGYSGYGGCGYRY